MYKPIDNPSDDMFQPSVYDGVGNQLQISNLAKLLWPSDDIHGCAHVALGHLQYVAAIWEHEH